MNMNAELINRWRLILGKYSENHIDFRVDIDNTHADVDTGVDSRSIDFYREIDAALEFLYNREYGTARGIRIDTIEMHEKKADTGESVLTIPEWITKVRELFPKEAREILEDHALERYNLTDLLTDKSILRSLEPNISLLRSILHMKDLFDAEVLETANSIVERIVHELMDKFYTKIRRSLTGKINKTHFGGRPSIKTINFKRTILKNLKNYDIENKRIMLDKIYFNSQEKLYNPWHIILAIDQSGSMINSVIHSSIMGAIFAGLSNMKTRLVLFDTSVVDLSEHMEDPVKTLMGVQLGGGTDIAQALEYSCSLIENPKRTIMILISDLYEGGSYSQLYSQAGNIIETGAKFLVLTAVDYDSVPDYDKNAAKRLRFMGADVGAVTPDKLAEWIRDIIKH